MKEIDFLPEWYSAQRRRNSHYRTQYVGIGCLLVLMLAWTATAWRSTNAAKHRLARLEGASGTAVLSSDYMEMKKRFEQLNTRAALLSDIDPRIKVAEVIGEISYMVGEHVKLGRLYIQAEKFPVSNKPAISADTIRAVREATAERSGPYEGEIKFKVIISGIAADSTRVAELVNRLEESQWFSQVVPVYSRNGRLQDHTISEFEITCYIANYTEITPIAAMQARSGQ